MESDDVDPRAAAAQLSTLRADRAALADRVVQPWWHDVACGLLLFGLAGVAWTYWRRTGLWGHPDRTVWMTWVPLVVVVLVPAFVLADRHVWAMPVAGAVLGIALALLGRRWSRQWAAELRSAS